MCLDFLEVLQCHLCSELYTRSVSAGRARTCRMSVIKRPRTAGAGKGGAGRAPRAVNCCSPRGTGCGSPRTPETELPPEPAMPLLGVCPKKPKRSSDTRAHPVFTAVWSAAPADGQRKKLGYTPAQ